MLATAAGAQAERRTLPGREVRIHDLVGAVTIEGGNVSDVTVEVTLRGADASRLKVETGTDGGVSTLGVAFPDDDIVYPGMGRSSNWSFSMSPDRRWGALRLPSNLDAELDIETGSGGIDSASLRWPRPPRTG